jgi:hypothetical protein
MVEVSVNVAEIWMKRGKKLTNTSVSDHMMTHRLYSCERMQSKTAKRGRQATNLRDTLRLHMKQVS